MRDPASRIQVLDDLRFALDVMEERSHIGLDDKMATAVRAALLRRIAEAERTLPRFPPSEQMEAPIAEERLTA